MRSDQNQTYHYTIMDPTGNITALVEGCAEISRQPFIGGLIMKEHPEVEQVGFVELSGKADDPVQLSLRMAGGEFCGNASMAAAALYAERMKGRTPSGEKVHLKVSGAAEPVTVRLKEGLNGVYEAGVKMPKAIALEQREFEYDGVKASLPLIRLQGISHVILEDEQPLSFLKDRPEEAEKAIVKWCGELGAEGMGCLFLSGSGTEYSMTPLVYIPESGTVFWENSCASGSCALGMYFAKLRGKEVLLTIRQPGGTLRVSGSLQKETWIFGSVKTRGNDHIITPI